MRIFNNISSLTTQRSLAFNNKGVGQSVQRIASGLRINQSSDDNASFMLSERMNADTITLQQSGKNATSGISMINIAEGALGEVASIIVRLKELASIAANGTYTDTERGSIGLEFEALQAEIDRITNTTDFNNTNLLDGTLAKNSGNQTVISLGLTSATDNLINLNEKIDLTDVSTKGLGINATNISTQSDAILAIRDLDDANDELSSVRARVGAIQSSLTRAVNNLKISVETFSFARQTLRDADLGMEFMELTKNQLLVQSSAAMVGQSNLMPQSVLSLLQ